MKMDAVLMKRILQHVVLKFWQENVITIVYFRSTNLLLTSLVIFSPHGPIPSIFSSGFSPQLFTDAVWLGGVHSLHNFSPYSYFLPGLPL